MKTSIQRLAVLPGQPTTYRHAPGFTLLETIVLVMAIGILFTIMAPGWSAFMNTFRLSQAQTTVLQAMRDAQGNARRNHLSWQASFRELNGSVQWAIHPSSQSPLTTPWNNLGSEIQIDPETSLHATGGIYRVRFDDQGNVSGQLGRLTLASRSGGRTKRCVIVSTLLGAMRLGENRPTPQDGRFCW